jgi:hypothetical protein
MNVGSTVAQSILLTILWLGFAYVSSEFNDGEPPKAIEVLAESVEIETALENKELPESVVQRLIDKQSGPFMTKEELRKATEEYERNRWLLAGLSVLLGIGTFVVGMKLVGHWGYAVAALALGPVLVAYYFLYKANLPSTPTPSLPLSYGLVSPSSGPARWSPSSGVRRLWHRETGR